MKQKTLCKSQNCGRISIRRGFCNKCSQRFYRNGNTEYIKDILKKQRNAKCYIANGVGHVFLKNGYYALVDECDFQWALEFFWCLIGESKKRYVGRYIRRNGKKTSISMHRALIGVAGLQVDHINGNGLDNRRCNLRLATVAENQRNKSLPRMGKYRGVEKVGNVFRSRVRYDGVVYECGYFDLEEEAAIAYNTLAKQLHGEFATLNKL